jgi:hypothetical protein
MKLVPPPDERRRAVRVEPGPLRVRLAGRWDGILVDISEFGALVQLPVPQTIHDAITLEVEWEHATLQLAGRVVRSSPPPIDAPSPPVTDYYVAVEFAPLADAAGAAIRSIVRRE